MIEVLAAMLLMAIVIPVAIEGFTLAQRAGAVAERKREAARLADSVLTEAIVTEAWRRGELQGDWDGARPGYRWTLTRANSQHPEMSEVWVEVFFEAQGRERSVRLATLASNLEPPGVLF